MGKRWAKVKQVLKRLYQKYNHYDLIKPDPLQFVYKYAEPFDREIIAFLAAALAYGRVEQIEKSLSNLFTRMGESPYTFVQGFGRDGREKLIDFKHRFTTGQDISDLLALLKQVLKRYGSIENFFIQGHNPNALCREDPPSFRPKPPLLSSDRKTWGRSGEIYSKTDLSRAGSRDFSTRLQLARNDIPHSFLQSNPNDKNIIPALTKFCNSLYAMYSKDHNGQISSGLKFLLASPDRGSACKRLNLFLRWMVRKDDVDVGLWKSIDKAKLIVPVDVHIGRLSRILGFYNHKTISLASAVEITESFAQIEPADPVKFDFALSRIGITEGCNGKFDLRCNDCELVEFCK